MRNAFERRKQTRGEEIANSITHGIGTGLSIAALSILVVLASLKGDPWRIVSFSIYGAALVMLYLASTMYHSFQLPRIKRLFRRLDHTSIYLLIAGTYTPFTLVCMRGASGWVLFGLVWGVALLGVVFETFYMGRFPIVSTLLYIAMGWLVVVALKPALSAVPTGALPWLVAGGVCYMTGVVFYALHPMPYHHTVWHLFVMGGSILHFFAMLLFVLPDQT